jgi:hypothetical protein
MNSRKPSLVVLAGATVVCGCGSEPDERPRLAFIHIDDDGNDVVVEGSMGPGDGTYERLPTGATLVARIGESEARELTLVPGTEPHYRVSFGRKLVGVREPIRVELRREGGPLTFFELALAPPFEAPRVTSDIKLDAETELALSLMPAPPDAFFAAEARATCASLIDLITPTGQKDERVIVMPLAVTRPEPVGCEGRLGVSALRSVTKPDQGEMTGRRFRGRPVKFVP